MALNEGIPFGLDSYCDDRRHIYWSVFLCGLVSIDWRSLFFLGDFPWNSAKLLAECLNVVDCFSSNPNERSS